MAIACARDPFRCAEQPGRRRQRRLVIRIRKGALGTSALTTSTARRRQRVIILIGTHDGRQPLFIDAGRRQTVLRHNRRSGHYHRNRQRQQKSS
jgi:hypothetical protein